MTTHERLVKAVEIAVENLMTDTSVPMETTREDLIEIRDEIEMKIDSLGD